MLVTEALGVHCQQQHRDAGLRKCSHCLSSCGRCPSSVERGVLDGEERLRKLPVSVAEDAVCICCVALGHWLPDFVSPSLSEAGCELRVADLLLGVPRGCSQASGLRSHLEFWQGRSPLQVHSSCWQNSFPEPVWLGASVPASCRPGHCPCLEAARSYSAPWVPHCRLSSSQKEPPTSRYTPPLIKSGPPRMISPWCNSKPTDLGP